MRVILLILTLFIQNAYADTAFQTGDSDTWNVVKDGGCDNTLTSDATSCLQYALTNYCGVKRIYIPFGSYKITSSLSVTTSNCSIEGDGHGGVKIVQYTDDADGIIFGTTGVTKYNMNVRNISFVHEDGGSATVYGGTGIKLLNIQNSYFENVEAADGNLGNAWVTAWLITSDLAAGGTWYNQFMKCVGRSIYHATQNATPVALKLLATNNEGVNSNLFIGGHFYANNAAGIGISLVAAGTKANDNNVFLGTTTEVSSGGIGVNVTGVSGTNQYNVFIGMRTEGNNTAGFKFDTNSRSNMTIGNLFTSSQTDDINDTTNSTASFEVHIDSDRSRMLKSVTGFLAFSANDATPSVKVGGTKLFQTANSNPTTITTFDDSYVGQEIVVRMNDANTTIDFTGTNLKGNAGVDWTPGNGDFMRCTYDGTNWYCTITDTTA